MRLGLLLCASLLGGCAPLNPLTMREPCRTLYNECLNGCQKTTPPRSGPTEWQIDLASCTNRCNDQARACLP